MAQVIKIKRSTVTSAPTSLSQGELAYSQASKKLFIGQPGGTSGDIITIGGQYYTDIIDQVSTAGAIALTGDVTGTSSYNSGTGVWTISTTIQPNSVALGTDTTGSYVATLADSGTGNLVVSGSGSETAGVTLNLSTTGVTAGSYGSASAVPTFTVDAYGRLTAAGSVSVATTLNITGDTGSDGVSLLSETLNFQGLTGITTVVTDDNVSIHLDDTAVTPGSYGSGTSIPTFTVDQQGRLTAASSTAVATTLNITGDSGTDGVALLSETLNFEGLTGITTAVTDDNVSINLDNTAVTPGSYGSLSAIPTFTVDPQGRLTAAGTVSAAFKVDADVGSVDTVPLNSTLTFAGDTGITTTVSNNQIAIDLDDTAVTPGSYGSATSIPTFTVDQQGRLTAAGAQSVATTLNITGDSGTDGVALLSETLNFEGGTGVTTTVSDDNVKIDIGQDVSTAANVTFNNVQVNGTLTSDDITSTNISVDGNATITGNLTVNGTTTTVNSSTVTVDDIILTLGGDTAPTSDDNLDRGIEFRWHNGSAARLGFFGRDDSTGEFVYIPEATNTANVMSGTKGAAYFGSLKLDTDLAVTYGGTGRATFTSNGIVYGNGTSPLGVTAAGTWDSTHAVGQILSVNAAGTPTWTNTLDGGSF